jgi:hypothetical protein
MTWSQDIPFKGLRDRDEHEVPIIQVPRAAKYCIYGSYLIAIHVSKIQCLDR